MIWHFFNCYSYHIAPHIIKHIIKNCHHMKTSPDDHKFLLYNARKKYLSHYKLLMNQPIKLHPCSNVFSLFQALRKIKANDIIILHSFSYKLLYFLLPLLGREILHRIVMICWGRETELEGGPRGKLKKFLKHSFFSRFHRVIALDSSDAKKLKENYGLDNITVCPYPLWPILENICTAEDVAERYSSRLLPTKVIVGSNGSKLNRHIDCLRLLERYRNQDVQIVCPFGYRNDNAAYTNEVASYGQKAFGDKFVLVEQFIPIEQYVSLLKSADIFIIHCERQRALFNIYAFLFQGKKIYVPRNTELKSWLNELEVKTFDIEFIADESYEEFSAKLDYDTALSNIINARKILSNDRIYQVWSEIYSNLGVHST